MRKKFSEILRLALENKHIKPNVGSSSAHAKDKNYFLERQSKNPIHSLRCFPRTPEDGRISWDSPAIDILRLINASNKPYSGAYCSSKSALINFAESIYNECYKNGILVRIVCPGFVKTPLTDKNTFKMPMIIPAETAGKIIYNELLNSKRFEIIFPKVFCYFMKLLRHLPNFLYLKLTAKLLKKL